MSSTGETRKRIHPSSRNNNNNKNKKPRIDNTHLSSYNHTHGNQASGGQIRPSLPSTLRVAELVAARRDELTEFVNVIKADRSKKRCFQKLHKDLRRRAQSHNPYRVPKKQRGFLLREFETCPPNESRRPRKDRRRPRALLELYSKRSRISGRWLETHIWHAKRMHMEKLWGYNIAASPVERCQRKLYRHAERRCVIHDRSYLEVVEIQSTSLETLRCVLTLVMSSIDVRRLWSSAFQSGRYRGTASLYDIPVSNQIDILHVQNQPTGVCPKDDNIGSTGYTSWNLVAPIDFLWCQTPKRRDIGTPNSRDIGTPNSGDIGDLNNNSLTASNATYDGEGCTYTPPIESTSLLSGIDKYNYTTAANKNENCKCSDTVAALATGDEVIIIKNSPCTTIDPAGGIDSKDKVVVMGSVECYNNDSNERSLLWIWVHPAAARKTMEVFHRAAETITTHRSIKVDFLQIKMLRDLNLFELYGRESLSRLRQVLRPTGLNSQSQYALKLWKQLQSIHSTSPSLTNGSILALEIKPTEILGPFPPRRYFPDTADKDIDSIIARQPSYLSSWPLNVSTSRIFFPMVRRIIRLPIPNRITTRSKKRKNMTNLLERISKRTTSCRFAWKARKQSTFNVERTATKERGDGDWYDIIDEGIMNSNNPLYDANGDNGDGLETRVNQNVQKNEISSNITEPIVDLMRGNTMHNRPHVPISVSKSNERSVESASIPILIVYRRGQNNSQFCSGYDIIMPSGCGGDRMWNYLTRVGCRPLGFRDRHKMRTECGLADFPYDYPDTGAGVRYMLDSCRQSLRQHLRRPPSKRVNFPMIGITSPFIPDFRNMLSPTDTAKVEMVAHKDNTSVETRHVNVMYSAIDDFLVYSQKLKVIRGLQQLRYLSALCRSMNNHQDNRQQLDTSKHVSLATRKHVSLATRKHVSMSNTSSPLSEALEAFSCISSSTDLPSGVENAVVAVRVVPICRGVPIMRTYLYLPTVEDLAYMFSSNTLSKSLNKCLLESPLESSTSLTDCQFSNSRKRSIREMAQYPIEPIHKRFSTKRVKKLCKSQKKKEKEKSCSIHSVHTLSTQGYVPSRIMAQAATTNTQQNVNANIMCNDDVENEARILLSSYNKQVICGIDLPQTSRELIGFVTSGHHCLSSGRGFGLGVVSLLKFIAAVTQQQRRRKTCRGTTKGLPCIYLFARQVASRMHFPVRIEIDNS